MPRVLFTDDSGNELAGKEYKTTDDAFAAYDLAVSQLTQGTCSVVGATLVAYSDGGRVTKQHRGTSVAPEPVVVPAPEPVVPVKTTAKK